MGIKQEILAAFPGDGIRFNRQSRWLQMNGFDHKDGRAAFASLKREGAFQKHPDAYRIYTMYSKTEKGYNIQAGKDCA